MAFENENPNPLYLQHTLAGADPNGVALVLPQQFSVGTLLLDRSTGALWILRRDAVTGANPTWVAIAAAPGPPSGPAGGDLAGTFPNPQVVDLTITGEAQGDILYRNATNWVRLAAGTSGQLLQTNGAGANPQWSTVSGLPAGVQGNVLYHNGSAWVVLAPGTSGNFLQTNGAGANPAWAAVSGMLPAGVQGDLLYHNGVSWVTLGAGIPGRLLQTNGAGANPSWVDTPNVTVATVTTNAVTTTTTLMSVAVPIGASRVVQAQVTGVRTSGGNDRAGYIVAATYYNTGGGTTLQGTSDTLYSAESAAGWDCAWNATGSLEVTGGAYDVSWSGRTVYVSS